MSTGQLDGKTDDYINAYVENWINFRRKALPGIGGAFLNGEKRGMVLMNHPFLPVSDINAWRGSG